VVELVLLGCGEAMKPRMSVPSVVLYFLHAVYHVYIRLCRAWRSFEHWRFPLGLDELLQCDKLPSHMAVVLEDSVLEEAATAGAALTIIAHCVALQIAELTLFDAKGRIKASLASLGLQFEGACTTNKALANSCIMVRCRHRPTIHLGSAETKKGHCMRVNVLCLDDGRPVLADASLQMHFKPDSNVHTEGIDKPHAVSEAQHRLRHRLFAIHDVCTNEPELLIKVNQPPPLPFKHTQTHIDTHRHT
jgi:hypothetical protein